MKQLRIETRPSDRTHKYEPTKQFVAHLGNGEVYATSAQLRPLLPIPPQSRGVQRTLVRVWHSPFMLAEVANPLREQAKKECVRPLGARRRMNTERVHACTLLEAERHTSGGHLLTVDRAYNRRRQGQTRQDTSCRAGPLGSMVLHSACQRKATEHVRRSYSIIIIIMTSSTGKNTTHVCRWRRKECTTQSTAGRHTFSPFCTYLAKLLM